MRLDSFADHVHRAANRHLRHNGARAPHRRLFALQQRPFDRRRRRR